MIKTEDEFITQKVIPTFSRYFKTQREVWSKCKNGRIDVLLTLNDSVHFGIECKKPDSKRGERIGEYVKQAIRYSEYEFNVGNGIYKKIPIFICPALSYKYFLMNQETTVVNGKKFHKDRHDEFDSHHSFNGFLGSLNVGEVRNSHSGKFILSFSNKIIFQNHSKWNSGECIGLHEKNYNLLLKKLSICQI